MNEVINAIFDDQSGYEIYIEAKIIKRLQLKYTSQDCNKKECIARMIAIKKFKLNKLINKRAKTTHQKKISSKRNPALNSNRKITGTFTIRGPNCEDCFDRDGFLFSSESKTEIVQFNNYFYMGKSESWRIN